MAKFEFINDVKKLREAAKQQIESGVVTSHYAADLKTVVNLLNIALATELVCVLRYKSHHYKAKHLGFKNASDEFLEHAEEEQEHADVLSERITQLGEQPKLDPSWVIENSHSQYVDCKTIGEMIRENLIAERIAIDTYRQMVNYIGNDDPTTTRILEDILSVEEEHADDLLDLKAEYNIDF